MEMVLNQIIREENLFVPGVPVVVGVSGGADSLALLHLLHGLGYRVICCHVDHSLRAESAREAEFVRAAADRLRVLFVGGTVDVVAHRAKNRLSLEEAARDLRYRFLFQQARKFGAQAVAVAHTADDQVETVLMHFLRGAGVSGLKGMVSRAVLPLYDASIPLVRPLLKVWKEDLFAYLKRVGVSHLEDPSNTDPRHFRNRIRHELLPVLATYNPAIRKVLFRTSQVLMEDDRYFQSAAERAWEAVLHSRGKDWIRFRLNRVKALPSALLARVLRRGILSLRPQLRDIDFGTMKRAMALLAQDQPGECELVGGLRWMAEYDDVWIGEEWDVLPVDDWPQVLSEAVVALPVGGHVPLAGHWRLESEYVTMRNSGPGELGGGEEVYVNPEALAGPLVVRSRQPGDRFRPLGMPDGTVKVADAMINLKIPARLRDRWPLVLSGDQIIWLAGKRLADTAALDGTLARALRLRLARG